MRQPTAELACMMYYFTASVVVYPSTAQAHVPIITWHPDSWAGCPRFTDYYISIALAVKA